MSEYRHGTVHIKVFSMKFATVKDGSKGGFDCEIIKTLKPLLINPLARYMVGRIEPSRPIIMSQTKITSNVAVTYIQYNPSYFINIPSIYGKFYSCGWQTTVFHAHYVPVQLNLCNHQKHITTLKVD
jgi:hypothetical protein